MTGRPTAAEFLIIFVLVLPALKWRLTASREIIRYVVASRIVCLSLFNPFRGLDPDAAQQITSLVS